MKVMILAAGFGKRMLPLTAVTPKPLLLVNEKPLIEYHIERLRDAGIIEIVINHAHLGQQIENHCGDGSRYGVKILYSREIEPLETAGGISKALELLGDEPFISVNGDIWTDYDFSQLTLLKMDSLLAHLVLVDNPEFHTKGDFSIADNGFLAVGGANALTYSGIAILSKALFERYNIHTGPLAPLLKLAMADNQVTGEYFYGNWFDVGTPERLMEVSEFVNGINNN